MGRTLYSSVGAVIIVVDVTQPRSLDAVPDIVDKVIEYTGKGTFRETAHRPFGRTRADFPSALGDDCTDTGHAAIGCCSMALDGGRCTALAAAEAPLAAADEADVDEAEAKRRAEAERQRVRRLTLSRVPVMLVGNKSDVFPQRLQQSDLDRVARGQGLTWKTARTCSCKKDDGVYDVLKTLRLFFEERARGKIAEEEEEAEAVKELTAEERHAAALAEIRAATEKDALDVKAMLGIVDSSSDEEEEDEDMAAFRRRRAAQQSASASASASGGSLPPAPVSGSGSVTSLPPLPSAMGGGAAPTSSASVLPAAPPSGVPPPSSGGGRRAGDLPPVPAATAKGGSGAELPPVPTIAVKVKPSSDDVAPAGPPVQVPISPTVATVK